MVGEFSQKTSDRFNELCGESRDVNSETIEEWVAKLPSIIQGYGPENIANGDETGLFFRALPNKSLYLKGKKCSGGKMCKERLTVFLCGFISSEIEKPLLIGKQQSLDASETWTYGNFPLSGEPTKRHG